MRFNFYSTSVQAAIMQFWVEVMPIDELKVRKNFGSTPCSVKKMAFYSRTIFFPGDNVSGLDLASVAVSCGAKQVYTTL